MALSGAPSACPGTFEHVDVQGSGGTILDGTLRLPNLVPGQKVPVILWSSPYFGSAYGVEPDSCGSDALLADAPPSIPIDQFVSDGYAVAAFNVRGTGGSGGCMELFGPDEQADQSLLVQWAARQSWSSGQVAMIGDSYDATTALEAAVQAPAALKAVVAVAPVPDVYQLFSTPQGAWWWVTAPEVAAALGATDLAPSGITDAGQHLSGYLAGYPSERVCNDVRSMLTDLSTGAVNSDRDAAFWRQRDVRDRLSQVKAAVLYTFGYYDDQYFESYKAFGLLANAPKKFIIGPWPHQPPPSADNWYGTVGEQWLNYWLKGIGPVPAGLDQATWQDVAQPGTAAQFTANGGMINGTPHTSSAWPPPEATQQSLYLNDGALTTTSATGELSYHSTPYPEGMSQPMLGPGGWFWPKAFLCSTNHAPGMATRLLYQSEPATSPFIVAGNPVARLSVLSSEPGGIITLDLLDLPPGFCQTDGPEGAALISFGAVDLRFKDGGFTASNFPVLTPTQLQVDMTPIGQVIQPGHRLALLVSYGNPADHLTPFLPVITILGGNPGTASRLQLSLMGLS